MATATVPQTLQQAIEFFSDDARCHAFAVAMRWPTGVCCPTCGSLDVSAIESTVRKAGKPNRVRRLFQCKEAHQTKQFTVKTGSIFEDSPLPLKHWLAAMWMVTNCKNGVSSYEIARALGITQKSAWFVLQRLRLAMQDENTGGKLGGDVEVDETFIGGKARNMSVSKKRRLGITQANPMARKVAVMGVLQRHPKKGESQVRLVTLSDRRRHELHGVVQANVERGSVVNSDYHKAYLGLDEQGYIHNVVDHAEKYVDGTVHTNSLENFWSLLKRTLKGTYCQSSPSTCSAIWTNRRSASISAAITMVAVL